MFSSDVEPCDSGTTAREETSVLVANTSPAGLVQDWK
jgi:hypothetical protein